MGPPRCCWAPGYLQRFYPLQCRHGGPEGPAEGCRRGRAERHVSKQGVTPRSEMQESLISSEVLGGTQSCWLPLRTLPPRGSRSCLGPGVLESGVQILPSPSLQLLCSALPIRTLLPKLIPSGAGREWLERRRATIRPWGTFVDQQRFSRPRNVGELCQRLVRNVEYYQSNYVFVFLGLILYCV